MCEHLFVFDRSVAFIEQLVARAHSALCDRRMCDSYTQINLCLSLERITHKMECVAKTTQTRRHMGERANIWTKLPNEMALILNGIPLAHQAVGATETGTWSNKFMWSSTDNSAFQTGHPVDQVPIAWQPIIDDNGQKWNDLVRFSNGIISFKLARLIPWHNMPPLPVFAQD